MTLDWWKLVSVCLEIVLVLVQGRCTVCAERTIGSKIVLDAPDGTPKLVMWNLAPFGDSANLDAR